MKFDAYLRAYHSFYSLVVLQLGLTCPSRCRHCSVFAGPKRREQMPPDLARKIVRQFAGLDTAEVVMMTGGEPFLIADTLRAALEEIAQHPNLTSYVITSASWATCETSARATLDAMPPIGGLMISADVYHEEYIDLDCVRHAIAAATEREIDVTLSIALDAGDDLFLGRIKDRIGPALWSRISVEMLPVHPTGRAKVFDIGAFDTVRESLPDGACDLLGAPVFIHDGTAVACCQIDAVNEAARKPNSAYVIGNAQRDDVATLRDRVEDDVVFQALRVYGPRRLVELLRRDGFEPALQSQYDGICFLCRDLLRNSVATGRLKQLLQTQAYRQEIRLSRILQYGELRPCPAPPI